MATPTAATRSAGNGNGNGAGHDDPVYRIEETRAALRDAAGVTEGPARFPRSTAMQVALSPRYRWITAAVVGAAAIALWKRLPGRRVGLLIGAVTLARRMRERR